MRNILLAIILLTTVCVNAQEFGASIDARFVASQIDGDRFGGYNKYGFTIGGNVHRFLNKKNTIGTKAGLRYILKGNHTEGDDDHSKFNKTELHYVEMPLSAFYRWERLDVEVGLTVGWFATFLMQRKTPTSTAMASQNMTSARRKSAHWQESDSTFMVAFGQKPNTAIQSAPFANIALNVTPT